MPQADLGDLTRYGWQLYPGFLSDHRVAEIDRWCCEVFASALISGRSAVYGEASNAAPGQSVIRRIERFCDDHAQFDHFFRTGECQSLAEQSLGEQAVLFKEKINSKYPEGSGYSVHQDQQAGWTAFAPIFFTIMICVDEITTDNGGFRIGTNRRYDSLIAGEWNSLDPQQCQRANMVNLSLLPGDVVLFDSYVPHGSGVNASPQVRLAVFATYNSRRYGDQRDAYYREKHRSVPTMMECASSAVLAQ